MIIPDFNPGDIVYIGNQDNIGFMLVKYARERGIPAWLVIKERGIRRSDPDFLKENLTIKHKSFILDDYDSILNRINKSNRLNIFSSGIEVMDMLKNSTDNNNYYMIPTGSDLAMWPFVDKDTAATDHYLNYKRIFYENRFKIKRIFTSQLDCIYAATALGLKDRIIQWTYPSPIEYIKETSPIFLKEFGDPTSHPNKRIIFLPCRKNGDLKYTNYKGVEKIIKGIEYFAKNASERTLLQDIGFLNIHQGNLEQSYDCDDFKSQLKDLAMKYKFQVINIRDLEAVEFWSFLQDPRMAVIDQFGHFNGLMGGIGREAACCGRPVLTGIISTKDRHTLDHYGESPPIYTAYTANEIGDFILDFSEKSASELMKQSTKISSWALNTFEPKKGYNQILDNMLSI